MQPLVLKFEPKLQKYLKLVHFGEKGLNLNEVVSELSEINLLLELMSVCPLPDFDLEKLFKNIRAAILEEEE